MMNPMWVMLTLDILVVLLALLKSQMKKENLYRSSLIPIDRHEIRLLRLMPNNDKSAAIRCQLFNHSLESQQGTHLYEALSYVWGGPKIVPICINGHHVLVTENLYAALWHLRDCSFERTIWIDAICINQDDDKEKEQQIQSMAKIYSQANRVIVWLGKTADDSDQALQDICVAARDNSIYLSNEKKSREAIVKLLERPWFRRIWVLQEVAAARHVLIMCGFTNIDGYAFCLGLNSLMDFFKVRPELQGLIGSVAYLIRGAIFRPNHVTSMTSGSSLGICPLGELIDMYHTHKATRRHDKVYALLGMSSDDLSKTGLLPNYGLPWEKLLEQLTKFLLHKDVRVETWGNKEMAVIKSKGCVLGKVLTKRNSALDNKQKVEIKFMNTPGQLDNIREWSTHWTLQNSAKPIQKGDLICILQGTSKPTIIRSYKDYFAVILITVIPENIQTGAGNIGWPELLRLIKHSNRDFLLLWDWENTMEELEYKRLYERSMEEHVRLPESLKTESEKTESERYLDESTRIWDVALILGDSGEYKMAEQRLREAIKGYEIVFREEDSHMLKCQYGLTPLSWAAGNGYDAIVDFLLTKDGVNPDLADSQYGRTPLSWAAENGHKVIVKQLLETDKVDVDVKDSKCGRTPLSWAAQNGHEAIVKLLLETRKVDINVKDSQYGQTPLLWAARNGHKVIVKQLLETNNVDVDVKDSQRGGTPLLWAAVNGHEEIVKLLLETSKVNIDAKDGEYERTPLSWAAGKGHKAIVKLLLETHNVDVNTKANASLRSLTPSKFAKLNGHEEVAQLLQQYIKHS